MVSLALEEGLGVCFGLLPETKLFRYCSVHKILLQISSVILWLLFELRFGNQEMKFVVMLLFLCCFFVCWIVGLESDLFFELKTSIKNSLPYFHCHLITRFTVAILCLDFCQSPIFQG